MRLYHLVTVLIDHLVPSQRRIDYPVVIGTATLCGSRSTFGSIRGG